jgi:hypothetical protein
MTLTERIPCIVFAYHQLEMLRATLDGLSSLGDRLSVTVVENHSEHTQRLLKPFLLGELAERKIDRYILFRRNISNNAMETVLDAGLVPMGSSPVLLLTDGDVVAESAGWLDEQLAILGCHPEVMVCGVPLSTANLPVASFPEAVNWVPPPLAIHEDYVETRQSGSHLWLLRMTDLRKVRLFRRVTGRRWVDDTFGLYARLTGRRWALTKNAVARHLTWDLYADREHPYTRLRVSQSLRQTWCHYRYCPCDIWSRDGHRVYQPFMQVAQVPYAAILQGIRDGIGLCRKVVSEWLFGAGSSKKSR